MDTNVKLGVIGCGKMASAILGGVVKNSFLKPENIFVYDINPQASESLSLKYGFNVSKSIEDILNNSNTLLLAVKPFVIDSVLDEISKFYKNQLVLSIVAGVKLDRYEKRLQNAKAVRIMPNTPALLSKGMSAVCAGNNIETAEYDFAFDLMKNCGKAIKTTEDKIDAITALSGSGPAFYFKIINDMALCAQKLGLNYDEALLLSAQTALGSAEMVLNAGDDVKTLIKNVTTPGGCTEVGNKVLDESEIKEILMQTLEKTMQKAIDLGK